LSVGSPDALLRRLERERKARREAEAIAERVTGELYATSEERMRLNEELARANNELQATNQAMRDFVAVASHDLRSPLTSILGFTSTLTQRWVEFSDERRLEFLEVIERRSQHLARMVEDLLTISKIEAGHLDVHRDVVRLRDAFETAARDFAEQSDVIEIEPADDVRVAADPDHLQRILVNFIGNAFKYGTPPVNLCGSASGEWVEIRIRDHGEGVPVEFVPRLFGKFARAEATSSKPGTGLGLSIVRGLAQANGGDTWYEPMMPHGSCFALRLPTAS
jgi:signal transduction histidine kinase